METNVRVLIILLVIRLRDTLETEAVKLEAVFLNRKVALMGLKFQSGTGVTKRYRVRTHREQALRWLTELAFLLFENTYLESSI